MTRARLSKWTDVDRDSRTTRRVRPSHLENLGVAAASGVLRFHSVESDSLGRIRARERRSQDLFKAFPADHPGNTRTDANEHFQISDKTLHSRTRRDNYVNFSNVN